MKEAVSRAGEMLRELLENIPILQVESIGAEAMSGDWEPDLIARLLVDGRQHLLACAYKPNVNPGMPGPRCLNYGTTWPIEPPRRSPSSSPPTCHPP